MSLSKEELKLKELVAAKISLQENLTQLESQISSFEGSYLEDTQTWGNIFRGWDGYASNKSGTSDRKTRKFKDSDRLFSLSSCTAPEAERECNEFGEDLREKKKRKKKEKAYGRDKKMATD